jgi:hypothetical protein
MFQRHRICFINPDVALPLVHSDLEQFLSVSLEHNKWCCDGKQYAQLRGESQVSESWVPRHLQATSASC